MTSDLNERPLDGQVVVVTGAGRGIGRAIAIAVSNAGGKVAALARSQSELNETVALVERANGSAHAFIVDVTDAGTVQDVMRRIDSSLGPVDALVNNAGQIGRIGPFVESDPAEWWQVLNTNLRGPMLCTRAVLPGMIARRRGRVVNIAAGAGSFPYLSAYVTSKTALMRFTETVAAETKSHGICVFAVAPGTTRTAMSEHSLHSAEGRQWLPWFERIFAEKIDVPIERPARLVVELAAGRADALSGRFLTVFDDLGALLGKVGEIEREHLYSLQVRRLATAGNTLAALGAIHREGEEGR